MRTNSSRKLVRLSAFVITFLFLHANIFAQFTPGNIVVLQAGDGTNTLANTGNAIILREFTPNGTPGYSVSIPSSGTDPLIISGTSTSEGGLSLTPDLKLLVFAGYGTTMSYSSNITSATAANVNRGVGVVDAGGTFTRVTTSSTFYSGASIRSAASDGAANYWASGGNQGTNYFGVASAPVQGIQTTNLNTRNIRIFNNELYFSTGSGTSGIYKVGTGLPVTAGQATSLVIATAGPSTVTPNPYEFYFNPAMTICYVADERTFANGGGVMKFINTGSAWTYTYSLNTGTTSARGVIADFSGSNPIVYATTAEVNNNRLVAIEDVGAASTATLLATSGSSTTVFRGISFAPCAPPQIVSAVSGGSVCSNSQLSLSVTVSGSAPGYTWTGSGNFNNANVASPLVSNPQTGNYTITISNACGTASTVVAANVETAPVISIAASQNTLCAGEQLTLTASGADTYTWSNGITNGSGFTASANTVYTVNGTALNSCVSTETIDITVNPLPVISVNNLSVCTGDQGTLTATGANTYTWSTGSNNSSIVVNPTVSTSYTVQGTSIEGCGNQTTLVVGITNPPVISVNSATVCAGSPATLTASGADTYTWNTNSTSSAITVTPGNTTTYTVSGNINGCNTGNTQTTTVIVNQLPVLTVSSTSTLLCEGSTATLSAGGANSYSWSTGATTSVIAVSPTISTTYTLQGTDTNNCSNELLFTQNVTDCTGLLEIMSGNSSIVYPNPAKETFSFKVDNSISKAVMYSLSGNVVRLLDLNISEYNIDDLLPGVYLIVLSDQNGVKSVKKLIKE